MELDSVQFSLGPMGDYGMPAALALMMFAVALNLTPASFSFFKTRSRLYFGGVIAQIILLPLTTVLLCLAVRPQPSIALGMIIVACCPGGAVSNLLTLFARGNSALSVALTATSSVLACFATPALILFWTGIYPPTQDLLAELSFSPLRFLVQTFFILALPLALGMAIATFRPDWADRLRRPAGMIGAILLAAIIIGALWGAADLIARFWPLIIPVVIVHNALALSLGWASGAALRADTASRRALTLELGIQNSGLALVLIISQLSGLGGATAIAGIWGVWHILAGLAFMALCRWRDRRRELTGEWV